MNRVLLIAHNEFRQICREPQFLLPYFLIPLIMMGIYAFYILAANPAGSEDIFISRFLIVLVGVLVASMTLALCADSFAGEKERNTLEVLLCAPLEVRMLFWGKVAGIMPLPVLMGWLGQIVMLGVAAAGQVISMSMIQTALVLALTPVSAFFITSISIFISLKAETIRGAAQISGIIVLLFLFSMQFLSHWYFLSIWNAVLTLCVLLAVSLSVIYMSMLRFEDIIYSVK
jgi:ABC-type Na+ efflux pump permease subunit